jgi:cytochrome c oxidase subunit II
MMHSKSLLAMMSASVLLLSACNGSVSIDDEDDGSSSSISFARSSGPFLDDEDDDSSEGVELSVPSTSSAQAGTSVPSGETRIVTVNVTSWAFSPSTISVKKGEKVQLRLVGGDGIHSFAVPGLGMNVRVEPGQTVTVDLPTTTAGTFEFHCAIPCGSGHRDMKGSLVIS